MATGRVKFPIKSRGQEGVNNFDLPFLEEEEKKKKVNVELVARVATTLWWSHVRGNVEHMSHIGRLRK